MAVVQWPGGFGSRFWRVMLAIVVFGLISAALRALFPQQPDILGIGVWAGAAALCAIMLKALSDADDLLKALAAMWLPIVLIVAAGYLLFFNAQGRELGVSLLGENKFGPIFFLFLALIYWAANTWHAARLGLNDALENGFLGVRPSHPSQLRGENPNRRVVTGNERWLYWPPRLLGVCAHLFAAINLSLAAWGLPLEAWDKDNLPLAHVLHFLAWTAPLVIVLATTFVWAEDVKHSNRGKQPGSSNKEKWARRLEPFAVGGEILLVGGLAFISVYLHRVPEGFVYGTLSIILSALFFLGVISWMRNRGSPIGPEASPEQREEDDLRQRKEIERFTVWLFVVACIVTAAVWLSPVHVGRFLGSMVVAYFAFGAILALMNFFGFAVGYAIRRQVFGKRAKPRAVGAYALAFLIALGVVNAWLHPFHRVRVCHVSDCPGPPPEAGFSAEDRPTVAKAAQAWYAQAKAAFDGAHGEGPVPMLIVATAGGGIRAAYWTATVLEKLESDFKDQGGVRPYLFAISGVSGGSVGAMAFEAALTKRDENQCSASKAGDAKCPLATDFLKEDFLAPALASLVFVDAPSSFLPDLGQGDRGAALEKSFEHASGGMLARRFLSFFRLKSDAAANQEQAPWWRPVLLLNATHEETGNRIITGHVRIERGVFIDSLDALKELGNDVRASTAAHNSARFAYVSPAGNLGWPHGSVIDGGYFENFGALSALELANAARFVLQNKEHPEDPKVKLVILMISSDPDISKNHMLVRINEVKHAGHCLVSVRERQTASDGVSSNYFSPDSTNVENALINEFVAPFQGLETVREAHGNWAAAELASDVCAEFDKSQKASVNSTAEEVNADEAQAVEAKGESPYFAHLAMCEKGKAGEPKPIQSPLGWVLSKSTRDSFDTLLKTCGNEDQLSQLEIALGKPELPKAARQ